MVVLDYNPSYSGGRGRRMANLKPAQAKIVRLYLRNKIQIKKLGMWIKCGTLGSIPALQQQQKNSRKLFLHPLKTSCTYWA
jgi:hypothetical protein